MGEVVFSVKPGYVKRYTVQWLQDGEWMTSPTSHDVLENATDAAKGFAHIGNEARVIDNGREK